jgi:hypothetical protein
MVKLNYDLTKIPDAYVAGNCRARLKRITQKESQAGKPMLEFQWVLLDGLNQGKKINSYASLMEGYLGSLKEHLEALGESGEINKSSDELLGKEAVLVLTSLESDREGRTDFVTVSQVLPLTRGSKTARHRPRKRADVV